MKFVALLLFVPVFFLQSTKDEWHLKKCGDGISVFSRKTPNSEFRELKSIAYVKTSLNSIVALLNDWESYPLWVYRCGESSTLKKVSETEVVHYQTVIAPWPAENRDFIANIKLYQDEKTKVITIRSTCNATFIPKKPRHIRITEFNACWTLVPLKDGTVQVNYQLLVHPGGFVPAWLVNMAAIDGPYDTMVHFKEWILKEKYQKASNPLIKELNN